MEENNNFLTPELSGAVPINNKWYVIDYDKVKTIDDIKIILKAMDIGISDLNPNFHEMKYFLKLKDE